MKIKTHEDLKVYQIAFKAAMEIFKLSKQFPSEEKYSLTDQIRRSSREVASSEVSSEACDDRSVCANLAEAWRKRRYKAAFIAKLSDSESEATEVQVWLKFAVECGYLEIDVGRNLYKDYNRILGSLVTTRAFPCALRRRGVARQHDEQSRQMDFVTSPHLPVSPSPRHPVTPSPCQPISPSPTAVKLNA